MSLDTDALDYIEALVAAYMYSETSFTSLDVANRAKQNSHWARNNEVAKWLRSNAIRVAYECGCLYNQTLIRVDSKDAGNTLAYLYHHMNVDTDTYLDRDQNPQSMQKVTPIDQINQSIGRVASDPSTAHNVPDSFTSREAARDWVRFHTGYVVDDRGPYTLARWGVKQK
jgi:hypothetical protein